MKRCTLLLLLMLCLKLSYAAQGTSVEYRNADVETSTEYINGNKYQKDFLLFVDMLQNTHPAFATKYASGNPPELMQAPKLDGIKDAGYLWAANCMSNNDFSNYIQQVCSRLNDGHTGVFPSLDKRYIYPIAFYIDDNKNFNVQGISREYESFLGKKVEKINNQQLDNIIEGFRPLISSDNELTFLKNLKGYMQLYSIWQNTPYCMPDSSLLVSFDDGSEVKLLPQSQNTLNIAYYTPSNMSQMTSIRENTKQPFLYKILKEEGVCYLQFNQCNDRSSVRLQYYSQANNISEQEIEAKLSHIPRFDEFLQGMFADMKNNDIETLVVDVRNNSGGNSKLCDELLSWLKPINETKDFTSYIRFSSLWEQTYPQNANEYKAAFLAGNIPYSLGVMYNAQEISKPLPTLNKEDSASEQYEKYFKMNTAEDSIFKGNTIFIQNRKTYSSAGMLIIKAIDNGIGTVVGSESSYSPCSYGDALSWTLPNTEIKGFVSHKIFLRPDPSKCGEMNITPEVPMSSTWEDVTTGGDYIWEWILNNYSNKTE